MSVPQTWVLATVPIASFLLGSAAYLWGVRKVGKLGTAWPIWRTFMFVGLGMPLAILTVSWWPGARSHELFAAYMTQVVMLSLIIPSVLVLGAPARLWRSATNTPLGADNKHSVLDSSVMRGLTHPLMTPLLMLALPVVVVFTPVLRLTLENFAAYSVMQVLLLTLGLLALLGLVGGQVPEHGIPYAAAAFIAFFELILDAIPGGVLFFTTSLMAGGWYATHGDPGGLDWAASDQRAAGAILWAVGEGIDVPFLLVIVALWMQADAAEARRHDAWLDAQAAAAADAELKAMLDDPGTR
jgi:putative copper resistance protein D